MMNEMGCTTDASHGYRGYVGSRTYQCGEYPQYVQNMIIRHHCQKHHLTYLLSATEYAMPGCYMILDEVVNAIHAVKGIVMFSVFMLPTSAKQRKAIYQKILSAGRSLHTALEDLTIKTEADIQMVEDILCLNQIAKTENGMAGFVTA